MYTFTRILTLASLVALAVPAANAQGERIKDVVSIKGVRSNPLMGFGIVVGLQGTGDNSPAAKRALTGILRRNARLNLSPDDLDSKNIAAVIVTADLPPFATAGAKIDVTVSTFGNASSLMGGTLLMTPLAGADQQVYAVASGELSIGGLSASGDNASITKNHPTVGRIPGGAIIERAEISEFVENGRITLQLRNPDFSTAGSIARAINTLYPEAASPNNAGTVTVTIPPEMGKKHLAAFIDRIGGLDVTVDQPAVVVINERSGTIIVGRNVGISMVAITHGNLTIMREEKDYVSQPSPFSQTGTTEKIERTGLQVAEEGGALHVVPKQVSVSELARALNAMGLTPRDLISIFQALKKAGALQAELKIM